MSDRRPETVDIFISYSRADRPRVSELANALQALDLTIWFDAAIEPGVTFDEEIAAQLARAAVVIVCWSAKSTKSRWVRSEASIGAAKGKLVPLFLDQCELPPPFNIDHTEDLSDWHGQASHEGFVNAMRRIGRLLGRGTALAEWCSASNLDDLRSLRHFLQRFPDDSLAARARRLIAERESLSVMSPLPATDNARDALAPQPDDRGTASSRARPGLARTLGFVAGIIGIVVSLLVWHGGSWLPARIASPVPQRLIGLSVQRLPPTTTIFIDASPAAAAYAEVSRGTHEIVAVAPGYYGEIQRLNVGASTSLDSVSVALDASRLPTAEEERHFLRLTEASALTAADVSAVTERTLNTVILAQRLRQVGETSQLSSLLRDVETLRRFGDARSAVASLLINGVAAGHISRSQVTQSLIAASAAGDAMATLFIAVADREAMISADAAMSPTDPQYRIYCQQLALAATQGWADVADDYSRRDHCRN